MTNNKSFWLIDNGFSVRRALSILVYVNASSLDRIDVTLIEIEKEKVLNIDRPRR